MKVTVYYWNQLRAARGLAHEVITLDESANLLDLIRALASQEVLRDLLVDAHGAMQRWILVDRAGVMIRDPEILLADGDQIQLMTHMSGG